MKLNSQIIQDLKYIFGGYSLAFIFLISAYGLWKDTNESKEKGANRDGKIAKRIYITLMSSIVSIFIILRLM